MECFLVQNAFSQGLLCRCVNYCGRPITRVLGNHVIFWRKLEIAPFYYTSRYAFYHISHVSFNMWDNSWTHNHSHIRKEILLKESDSIKHAPRIIFPSYPTSLVFERQWQSQSLKLLPAMLSNESRLSCVIWADILSQCFLILWKVGKIKPWNVSILWNIFLTTIVS